MRRLFTGCVVHQTIARADLPRATACPFGRLRGDWPTKAGCWLQALQATGQAKGNCQCREHFVSSETGDSTRVTISPLVTRYGLATVRGLFYCYKCMIVAELAFSSRKSRYDRHQGSVQWLIVAGILLSSARVDLWPSANLRPEEGIFPRVTAISSPHESRPPPNSTKLFQSCFFSLDHTCARMDESDQRRARKGMQCMLPPFILPITVVFKGSRRLFSSCSIYRRLQLLTSMFPATTISILTLRLAR
jgi:hypothetical protein